MVGVLVKVLGVSIGLSLLIKYGGPLLAIGATATNALIAVWLPALVIGALLGWRWQRKINSEKG